MSTRSRLLVLALAPVVSLAACSTTYKVRPEDAAQAIVDIISEQNDYELNVADVHCPADIEAKVGDQFDCTFTGRGDDYVAHMRIQKVEGDKVLFEINAGPVGK
jgi:hypothetical protein